MITANRAVVVVFRDGGGPFRRWLRPGFRHCFVVVPSEVGWIQVDSLIHRVDIQPLKLHAATSAKEVADLFRAEGMTALVTHRRAAPRVVPPVPVFSCVEMVKRVIGLHDAVLTPYGLFRHLAQI